MTEQISEVVHHMSLDLGDEALQQELNALTASLKRQIEEDIVSLTRNTALWLHVLTQSNFVSVIDWYGPHALRYHFFHMNSSKEEIAGTQVKHDPGINSVGRFVTYSHDVAVEIFGERHTHTVVQAKTYRPEQYWNKVPARIARFVDEIPAEIKPFVTIIDGKVTQDRVTRKLVSKQVETEERKVWVSDPAVALFDSWALNGWGGSVVEPVDATYVDHPARRAHQWLIAGLIITALFTVMAEPFAGVRGMIVVAILGVIATAFSQFSMRLSSTELHRSNT